MGVRKKGGKSMLRISTVLATVSFIVLSPASLSSASADVYGCSYEKCLAVCLKIGYKSCSLYCDSGLKKKKLYRG